LDDMSMPTVAELLDDASLGLELVAGPRGSDREIEAAAVSELTHPGPWL
jgi:PucR family transcriptional regulator, purine catabolism regulatory protein